MDVRKLVQDLHVVKNIRLNDRHFLLELVAPETFPMLLPGQFVQALVKDSPSTFLRRPFSIHSVDYVNNTLRLLIQLKGAGTHHLSLLREGEPLNLIYPLGNSFSFPQTNDVLLIGGGCGVAPLLFLSQFLRQQHQIHPTMLLGFKTKEEVTEIEEYSRFGNVHVITDDGTEGEKGLVVDHSLIRDGINQFKKIYACGPEPMLRAIAKIAGIHHIDCEVSLENTMACGFGVCLCCVTATQTGNERVCVEGPVFNTRKLKWN
ncbi:MAG: dihydroorotate dehydrogenase electron transfer subunit [Bacteroidales bacterium]|nr:dihydroorotate dehydrogenase electron transfer subunit [Bacteroidales bacterium]